jgi:hypothetical protein
VRTYGHSTTETNLDYPEMSDTLKSLCVEYLHRGNSTVFSSLMHDASLECGVLTAEPEPAPAPAPDPAPAPAPDPAPEE